jgi:hypothetical protein
MADGGITGTFKKYDALTVSTIIPLILFLQKTTVEL